MQAGQARRASHREPGTSVSISASLCAANPLHFIHLCCVQADERLKRRVNGP